MKAVRVYELDRSSEATSENVVGYDLADAAGAIGCPDQGQAPRIQQSGQVSY
jgi:hypothetical protein